MKWLNSMFVGLCQPCLLRCVVLQQFSLVYNSVWEKQVFSRTYNVLFPANRLVALQYTERVDAYMSFCKVTQQVAWGCRADSTADAY